MRTATSTVGIAATVLIVSFLLPENRPSVPSPAYTLAQNDRPVTNAGQPAAAEDGQESNEAHAEEDSRLHADRGVLDKVLPAMEFEETPLEEVVDYLQAQIETNVYLNRYALEELGIALDVPITLSLKNVPFEQGLKFVLLEACQGEDALAFRLEGNVLLISTKDELGSQTEVRIYDCRDLINGRLPGGGPAQARVSLGRGTSYPVTALPTIVPASAQPAQTPATPRTMSRGRDDVLSAAGAGQPLRGGLKSGPRPTESSQQRANDFVEMIISTIGTSTWQTHGGDVGSVSQYDGFLIVRQTTAVHEEITDLLAMLRQAVTERREDVGGEPHAHAPVVPGAVAPWDADPDSTFAEPGPRTSNRRRGNDRGAGALPKLSAPAEANPQKGSATE